MPNITFHDFFLTIKPTGTDDLYHAEVLRSGGGDADAIFSWSELQAVLAAVSSSRVGTPDAAARAKLVLDDVKSWRVVQAQPPTQAAAKDLGSALFRIVFKDKLEAALQKSYAAARDAGAWLRLRLNLTKAPALAALPWELLFGDDRFYARSSDTPLVRYLQSDEPPPSLTVKGPLRMLVMLANLPRSPLNVEEEWERLKEAVKEYEKENLLEVERLDGSSADALEERLKREKLNQPFHIFHFIGHGAYDPRTREGQLLLTDESGKEDLPLNAKRLSEILRDHKETLRLAVLNACEGARAADTDSYAGVAQSLLREGGIPAVVAMQYKITDAAAIKFTRQFYGTLATGYPVETALTYARRALDGAGKTDWAEWATPVLYLRPDDGELFALKPARIPPPVPHIPPELAAHYAEVNRKIKDGVLVPFIGLDANLYGRQPDSQWEPGKYLPCSRELAAHLKNVFKYPDGEIADLVSVSQYAVVTNRGTPGELYNSLSHVFNGPYEPTPLHHFLARLPKLLRDKEVLKVSDPLKQRFVIATTTYDNLLERAFKETGLSYHVVSYITNGEQSGRFWHSKYANEELILEPEEIREPRRFPKLNDADPVILKLPGAVDPYVQQFAITEDHYADYLTHRDLSDLLPSQLNGKLKGSHHLFLGSSLRNWHLRALLYRIWGSRRASLGGWAVHPAPHQLDQTFWENSNVRPVQADFDMYIAGLGETLAQDIASLSK